MAGTKTYRLLTGSHGRFEDGTPVSYRAGQEIELNEAEAANLAGRVELIGPAPKVKASRPEPEPEAEIGDFDVSDMHWSKAAKLIGRLEEPGAVRKVRAAEEAGKARKGVLQAADERLAELEDQE